MRTAQVQGALWGARARAWAEIQEPAWQPLYEKVLQFAGVRPGLRLLDIGCGAGGFLVQASKKGAEVAGLDASDALVAIARRRLPLARIDIGDMEELPFDDQCFGLVTGINAFQFAGDVIGALREAKRVCTAKGRVLMLVWGRSRDCELLRATMPAVLALLPPAASSVPSPAFSEPGVIEQLMSAAGLSALAAEEISHDFIYADAETAWRAYAAAAPCVRAARHSGAEKVREAVVGTLRPFTRPDGSVVQRNRFRVVIGTRR